MFLYYSKKGFYVKSFGTGEKVKLPGTAPDRPNVYEFGSSYEEIYQDLLNKDKSLYPFTLLIYLKLNLVVVVGYLIAQHWLINSFYCVPGTSPRTFLSIAKEADFISVEG